MLNDEWIKGVFSDSEENQYMGILHVRTDLKEKYKEGNPVQFESYAEEWLEIYLKPQLASTTYVNYRQQMNKHILPAFGSRDLRSIESVDIQCFFNEKKYLKKESQRKLRGILDMIFRAAIDDMIIDRNPLQSPRIKYTNQQKNVREPLSVSDMQRIRDSIPLLDRESDQRYLAIQMSMALRPCEVLGLCWEDVDIENNLLHIRRNVVHPNRFMPEVKGLKTADSFRTLPISAIAHPYLEGEHEQGFIFGGKEPLRYQAFRDIWSRIRKQIDICGATGYTFRHTVLTDLYDATKDVKTTQRYAGHATPDMTMRRYVHGREECSQEIAKCLDSIYNEKVVQACASGQEKCE